MTPFFQIDILSSIRGRTINIKFKYYRHATFTLTLDNTNILVDPMYMKKGRIPPIPSTLNLHSNPLEDFPKSYPKLNEKDLLLITHHHFDHFDKLAAHKIPKNISVVSPANGYKRLQKMGYTKITPMSPGQEFTIRDFKILALPVKHAQHLEKILYKPGIGYVIQYSGRNIYISGDTILFDDLIINLKKYPLDLAIFYGGGAKIPIFGRHTLSHREILSIIQELNPQKSIVIHLDCLNHCIESRSKLRDQIDTSPIPYEVSMPLPGEEFIFDFS